MQQDFDISLDDALYGHSEAVHEEPTSSNCRVKCTLMNVAPPSPVKRQRQVKPVKPHPVFDYSEIWNAEA